MTARTRQPITACMIVRDEQDRLPAALDSLRWCDHLVVVDAGSTDRTVELARDAGATVVVHPWAGYAAQRNVALDHAPSDWVLEIDADERVSEPLRADIERFLARPLSDDVSLCVLPRRDRFLGRRLGPSSKYPSYRARLFRRTRHRHDEARTVHEGIRPDGRAWAMRGDLDHELASSLAEAVTDLWRYAVLDAAQTEPPRSVAGYARAVLVRPLAKTAFRVVVDGGWRDGWRGLVRIGLDVASDVVVSCVPRRARPPAGGGFPARRVDRAGEVRVVAVDRGCDAAGFLRAARSAGADVAIVTDAALDGGDWLHVERVPRLGPLHVARALDAIGQMRPIDQLVIGRARLPTRLLLPYARGVGAPRRWRDVDPAALVEELRRSTR